MAERAKLLVESLHLMNSQEEGLIKELSKIDALVDEVDKLEEVVDKLDGYTKSLHAQFYKLYDS